MTNRFRCDDEQRLIEYLYGEISVADRAGLDAHLASCAACAAEIEELRGVRRDLASWQPPEADLGFRIVREAATPARRRLAPGWAPVAVAAGLLLALAASVEVEYGNGAVVIRSGWVKAAPVGDVAAAPEPGGVAPLADRRQARETAGQEGPALSAADVQTALSALESRLRAEMATTRAAAPAAPVDRVALVRHVEGLIEASERRQQRELAYRLAQAMQDVDRQRQSDLVRIENGLGQIEGLTVQEGARQNRLINYLMRTSQQER